MASCPRRSATVAPASTSKASPTATAIATVRALLGAPQLRHARAKANTFSRQWGHWIAIISEHQTNAPNSRANRPVDSMTGVDCVGLAGAPDWPEDGRMRRVVASLSVCWFAYCGAPRSNVLPLVFGMTPGQAEQAHRHGHDC